MANGDPQIKVQAPFKLELGEFQGRRINQGLTGGGNICLGADWWDVLVVRDFPATG